MSITLLPESGSEFILLVEDNPGDARLTQTMLDEQPSPAFPRIHWVQTVDAALKVLATSTGCAAVLLDLGLPDGQGLQALHLIQAHARQAPIIVLTGDMSEDLGLAAVSAGAQDYLVKGSFDSRQLRRAIDFAAERTRLVRELELAQARVRDLYDNAPCGYHSVDSAGTFLHVNATALDWLGCSREELIGKRRITEFLNTDGKELFGRSFDRLKAEGRVEGLEFDLLSATGALRKVSVTATSVNDTQGQFLMSRTVMFDITELHHALEQLRRLNREQAAMLDSDLIGIVKLSGRVAVWTNRGLERIFGYAPGELQNQPSRLLYLDDESYDSVGASAYPVLRTGGEYRVQLQMRRRDGSPVWIDMSGFLVSPALDEAMWLLADITPLKEAEFNRLRTVQLEAENRQLQEASRLKSVFLSNMSHEMRTPLNAVIGFAGLLETGAVSPDTPKFKTYLGQIGSSGLQLLQLIDTVLDFGQAEAGKIEFKPEPVRLPELLDEVVAMQQEHANQKQIVIGTEVESNLTGVAIDPMRLKQVLSCYLSNAIKFSPGPGSVAIRARSEDRERIRIEVEDHGIGIADVDQPKLFKEFQQLSTGNTKAYQGTGMGLALVRKLVEAQGGAVGVRSTLGAGSVFFLILPCRRGTEAQLTQ
jgi:PAS domain S-box-containing protein